MQSIALFTSIHFITATNKDIQTAMLLNGWEIPFKPVERDAV